MDFVRPPTAAKNKRLMQDFSDSSKIIVLAEISSVPLCVFTILIEKKKKTAP